MICHNNWIFNEFFLNRNKSVVEEDGVCLLMMQVFSSYTANTLLHNQSRKKPMNHSTIYTRWHLFFRFTDPFLHDYYLERTLIKIIRYLSTSESCAKNLYFAQSSLDVHFLSICSVLLFFAFASWKVLGSKEIY